MKFHIEIALPVPLRQTFAYLPIAGSTALDYKIGARVKVPFGKSNRCITGIIHKISFESVSSFELKRVIEILDQENILSDNILFLVHFAANYYHYPLGEVYFSCMPALMRQGGSLNKYTDKLVVLNFNEFLILGDNHQIKKLSKTEDKLINLLKGNNKGLSLFSLNCLGVKDSTIEKFAKKNWVLVKDNVGTENDNVSPNILKQDLLSLNSEQQLAVNSIIDGTDNLAKFKCYLLYGITGSGKTEVYLHLIYKCLLQNKQVLVLVPEISLTPQTIQRFMERFHTKIAVIHSKIGVNAKTKDWLAAKENQAKIIIGTRSAVFTPIKNLGLIIIDEEHDQSFKQQEKFKYNGRDLAIIRANQAQIPIVLGSATPSIESMANVINNKYEKLTLSTRAGVSLPPVIKLLNIKQKKLTSGLSPELITLIKNTLKKQQQVLLFLNRRGYSPVLKCGSCNWGGICQRCNVYYTLHKSENLLVCHCCYSKRKLVNHCPECQSTELINYGIGTEQLEEYINKLFHEEYQLCEPCVRIDRDTIKKKNDLEDSLKKITTDKPQILLGTQMLAKGHHFPNVTLVAVLETDNGLFSTDFRAPERLTQLLLQVAGRAGRANYPSEVIIQTMQPEHKLLQDILYKNYWDIALDLYNVRKSTNLPPCNSWALIRAESYDLNKTMMFLEQVKNIYHQVLTSTANIINIAGPLLAPRVKKAGLFRGQLLLSAQSRGVLQQQVALVLDQVAGPKFSNVKWSIDIDPMDVY